MAQVQEHRPTPVAEVGRLSPCRVEVRMMPADRGNPYQRLLGDALAARGATVRLVNRLHLGDVLPARGRTLVIHLHWLEFIVGSTVPGLRGGVISLARTAHLFSLLLVARLRGIRIVWTVHNLRPHESRRPRLDHAVARLAARLADSVLAHSDHCATLIARYARRSRIDVACHGHYLGHYPPARRTRQEIRAALGFPEDALVLIAFGHVRPYKRLAGLIEAFRACGEPRLRLLIAGRPLNRALQGRLEDAAAADPRIVLRLESIPDEEVVELHQAADLGVLAYQDVFSSGALMLALSCGLPVLAPQEGTAGEIGQPPTVRCYPEGGLATALADSVTVTEAIRRQAIELAGRYSWDSPARAVLGE